MPRVIAIDDGTSNTKYAEYQDGNLVARIRPSTVQPGLLPDGSGKPCEFSYKIDGQEYTVYSESTDQINNDIYYQISDQDLVMVTDTLRTSGVTAEDPANIICTLPIEMFYARDNTQNDDQIARKKQNLLREINWAYQRRDEPLQLIRDVKVAPESLPGVFDILHDDHGQPNGLFNEDRYMCVDVGGSTTDIVILSSQGMIVARSALRFGALEIVSEISKDLCSEFRYMSLPHSHAVQATISKEYAGKDVSGLVDRHLSIFQDKLMSNIAGMIQKHGIRESFFVIGGGANFLREKLGSQAYIPEQPELCLARGMIKMSKGMFDEQ